jgi:UDP-N-acetylglucosamine 2-epimerase (non-hydrolysing)
MSRLLVVFGTRPEAIKMCPVILEMRRNSEIEPIICLTGQHKEMLSQVLDVFDVEADYNLEIMKDGQTLSDITTNVLQGISRVIKETSPDMILVHGDTTTSYAAALAGFYENVPVGHVEAGLRTNNLYSPYPEEFNRHSVDLISKVMFAPTENAMMNLVNEGKDSHDIIVTGNTVIDALKFTVSAHYTDENIEWTDGSRFILVTAHRRENWGDTMRGMFRGIKRIVDSYDDVKVIYPVHKNPIVRQIADEIFQGAERIRLIEPLEVVAFHNYLNKCYFVVTDSGGIQEEAPSLGKPVLIMRNTTERPEGIEAGTARLIGTSEDGIYTSLKQLLDSKETYNEMSRAINPYGDGQASSRIVQELVRRLK